MSSYSAASLAVGRWLVVSSLATAFACASAPTKLPPPDDDNPLPPGVNSDAGQFRRQITAFAPSGKPHRRARPGTCPFCVVNVSVEAVGDTREINPEVGPSPGRPVAHIVNHDSTDTESYYGIQPSIQAEYYLWVDRKPHSTRAQWTLLRVPTGTGNVTAGRPHDLVLCHTRRDGEASSSDADFAEYRHPGGCDGIASTEDMNTSQASIFPIRFAAIFARIATLVRGEATAARGGWIECARGCCT